MQLEVIVLPFIVLSLLLLNHDRDILNAKNKLTDKVFLCVLSQCCVKEHMGDDSSKSKPLLKDTKEPPLNQQERLRLYLELLHLIKMIWHLRSRAVLLFDALDSWGWCVSTPSTSGQLVQLPTCKCTLTFNSWLGFLFFFFPWLLLF